MLFSCRTASIIAVATTLVAACGDNHEVVTPDAGMMMPDSGIDEDGCRILTLGRRDFSFNLIDQLLGVRFPVTPNLDAATSDVLHVELWDSTTPDLPPLATGAHDLAGMSDLATCQYCVWVDVDATEDGVLDSVYVATEGTLTITKITDPLETVFAGHSSRIVLRRATVGDNAETTLVPDGDCVSIPALSFDTTPTPGQACLSAEDCGNALHEICDPSSNTCAAPECNFDNPCTGDNEICLVQYRDLFEGACYQTCNPSAATTGCPTTQQCVQRGVDETFGICQYTGEGAPGSTCQLEDNSTSCSDGHVCSGTSQTCAATCSFFAQDTGCGANTLCSVLQLCEPPSAGINVQVGQACGDTATQAQGCAADGEAFRGICFGYEGDPLMCHTACLGDQGCADGEFCAMRYTSGLGICLPNPVCGDGELGEVNEVCDDGNTEDNDGCSADCQTVDTDYLCGEAETLTLGASTQGDTSQGVDGLMSTCQTGIARAVLYQVQPPGRGRLRLTLTSATSQTLSLRTTCTDGESETACLGDFGIPTDQELIVQIVDENPAALTVMVSAMTVIDQASFTIEADFIPEDCGDGTIAGREVCDDGNETGNDGCSADCRAIEYDYYCSEAPVLSTSATNLGTLEDAPVLYPATCAADDGAEPRQNRMYTFTAPVAGTLDLQLTDDTSFAVLTIREGCGAPDVATELDCRPAFLNGELSIELTAGQSITVVVASYFPDQDLGTFTLDASFTAQ